MKTVTIWQPQNNSWEYLVGRNTFGIKYKLVCSIGEPRIIWLSGPYKGAARDSTISEYSGIKTRLHGECLLADKIYKGDHISFITPLPGHRYTLPHEDNALNYLIYCARQTIERIIQRLSTFGIFHGPWRSSIRLHAKCTKVSCKLVNLFLFYEPLG